MEVPVQIQSEAVLGGNVQHWWPQNSIEFSRDLQVLSQPFCVIGSISSELRAILFVVTFSIMLAELDAHKDAWPFRLPVDTKAFPLYKKVIKKPMDLSLIYGKTTNNK